MIVAYFLGGFYFVVRLNSSGDAFMGNRSFFYELISCHPLLSVAVFFLRGFLVSNETVVLRRWGRSKQKFGFIKRVDKC